MKKKLAVLTALLVLSAVVLGTAYRALQSSMKQVEVECTTWMGDPAAAEGLELKLNSSMEKRLFWKTTLDWGSEPETEFSYFQEKQSSWNGDDGVHIRTGLYMSVYGDDLLREQGANDGSVYEEWEYNLFQDISHRTEPGMKRTEVVDLRDYVETIPIQIWLWWENLAGQYTDSVEKEYIDSENSELQAWGEFVQELECAFQFPLLRPVWIAVSIEKNENGEVTMTDMQPASGPAEAVEEYPVDGTDSSSAVSCQEDLAQIYVVNAVGQQYVYFVVEAGGKKTGVLDYSRTPGGYGVYRMPRHTGRPLTMDDVEMVCPLDPERWILEMAYNKDESQLLLTTAAGEEQKDQTILILDAATGEKIQELPKAYNSSYYAAPDFLVQLKEQELTLLRPDESGQYRPVWTVDRPLWQRGVGGQRMEMACDGKTLSVVSFRHDWYYCPEAEVVVEVYDQTGPLFAGKLSFSNFWPTQSSCAEEEELPNKIYTHVNDLSVTWK